MIGRLLLACTLLLPTTARATEIAGEWSGTGTLVQDSIDSRRDTDAYLRIEQDGDRFYLQECWRVAERDQAPKKRCLEDRFERRAESLYLGERKVGDLFPGRILIYQGTRQVGEQITVTQLADGVLRYRYFYINMDGASELREATLRPVQP